MKTGFLLTWNFTGPPSHLFRTSKAGETIPGLVLDDRSGARVVDTTGSTLVWLGDLVLPDGYTNEMQYLEELMQNFESGKVIQAGGHFYCFHFEKRRKVLYMLTGFGAILPVYYTVILNHVYIASDLDKILNASDQSFRISRRFVLEKMLFHYPLFNHTLFQDVFLLPAHHWLRLCSEIRIERYFNPASLVRRDPVSARQALTPLSRYFRTRLRRYWPDESFALSFTGGFDGRTLLACALKDQRHFTAYAFGSPDSEDLLLPLEQAQKLGIDFLPLYLGDSDYLKNSLGYGMEFVEQSAGIADNARAHYVYAARRLAQSHRFLITGNFGSELFRAMHVTGPMIAHATFRLFAGHPPEKVLAEIKDSADYRALNASSYREAEEELIEDLRAHPLLNHHEPSRNERFYCFLLEEVFRKYFGPEITMQNHYLINRTPFLDFQFVLQLFSTQLAGLYSGYYEHNPVKRKKGQLLYSQIISDVFSPLYNMKTIKGYAPRDVLHPAGNLTLLRSALRKKMQAHHQPDDPFSVQAALMNNLGTIRNLTVDKDCFDLRYLSNLFKHVPGTDHKTLLKAFSLNWYILKKTLQWSTLDTNSSY